MSTSADEFTILDQEVCELHLRWNILDDLFSEEANVEVLDECAPTAFATIRDAFVDLVIVGITRLVADKDHRALTLKCLADEHQGTDLGKRLDEILTDLRRRVEPLKSHRDKRIAHHDADITGSPRVTHPVVLPPVAKSEIEGTLEGIRDFMNEISRSRDGCENLYERIIGIGDGKDIVHCLKSALQLESLRERAWRGTPSDQLAAELRR